MDWIINNLDNIIAGLLMIVGGASILAKLTPTEKDDMVVDRILALLHKLALNPKKDKARR